MQGPRVGGTSDQDSGAAVAVEAWDPRGLAAWAFLGTLEVAVATKGAGEPLQTVARWGVEVELLRHHPTVGDTLDARVAAGGVPVRRASGV